MTRKSKVRSVVVALVAIVLLAVPAQAMAGLVNVKIAVAYPYSTTVPRDLGEGMRDASKLAVTDNAAGLASAGVAVTVESFNDQADPTTAKTVVAPAIVGDSAFLGVVGHWFSPCSIAASEIYNNNDLTMITPMSTSPALTTYGRHSVFRVNGNDNGQAAYGADVVARKLGLARAYLVDDSTTFGRTLSSAFGKRFKADGGKIVGSAHTGQYQTSFTTLVKKIKAAKPTVVYYGGDYYAGGYLAKALKAKGVTAQFVGGDAMVGDGFAFYAGRSRADGALGTCCGLPTDQTPGGLAFRARSIATFGAPEVGYTDAYAYDAATAIIKAIIGVATDDGAAALTSPSAREAVRARVAASDFAGITGQVKFASNGETIYPTYSAWRVKSATFRSCANVGKPVVAAKVARNVNFAISGSLSPHHTAGSKVVTVKIYRKSGTKWVVDKSVWARASGSGAFSTYSVNLRLSKRGSYRAIASHSDTANPYMRSLTTSFVVK